MRPRVLFIAGASGATGKVLVQKALAQGLAFRAHYRPTSVPPEGLGDRAVQFDLRDGVRLRQAMEGATTVLQLIGTMRRRFGQGDTYESSDIATTTALVEAARHVGADHFILLSALGAGTPIGSYLQAKARAEAIAKGSALPTTLVRPSALMGPERRPPPGMLAVTRLLGLRKAEPISLETLAEALLRCAQTRSPLDAVVEGEALFELGGAAGA